MNRETKYRAYHKNLKIEVDVLLIDWLNELVDLEGGLIEQEFGDVVLIRYTGLKDKYGVEIYEGDIVEAYFWNEKLEPIKEKGFIEFQSGSFIFKFDDGTWEYLDGNEGALVVGNIYENPELLEREAE